ncbi:ankyrin repeat and death domain-containing protein 1A-like, partial [Cimex lectularius]|uniref:Uncharacterized protein n=1 Tax=Cimex lectularius TaxID=79782 RepID=A0A8I6SUA8_CIMLE
MRPLLMAAWHGNRDAVELLINSGAKVTAVNKKQYGVIMCAARNNRVDVVEYLISKLDNFDLEDVDFEGNTSLHQASLGGHYQIVKKLLGLGANPNAVNK